MPYDKSLTPTDLFALGQKLNDAPPIEYNPWGGDRALTMLEGVALLKDQITAMRDKGYRVVQIAEFLTNNGFEISDAALYDAMRKLGCSLTRQKVPIAQALSALLAKAARTGPLTALPREHVVRSSANTASKSSSRKARTPSALKPQAKSGPDLIKIQPKAQKLLKKLKPADAMVFKEVLNQLRRGIQHIQLDAQTSDAGKIFAEVGLLRPIKQQGDHAYEVPFEIAHVCDTSRRTTPYRGD